MTQEKYVLLLCISIRPPHSFEQEIGMISDAPDYALRSVPVTIEKGSA